MSGIALTLVCSACAKSHSKKPQMFSPDPCLDVSRTESMKLGTRKGNEEKKGKMGRTSMRLRRRTRRRTRTEEDGGESVLTRCWVCRGGAVPLRCWVRGRSGNRIKERRAWGERDGERKWGKGSRLKGGERGDEGESERERGGVDTEEGKES